MISVSPLEEEDKLNYEIKRELDKMTHDELVRFCNISRVYAADEAFVSVEVSGYQDRVLVSPHRLISMIFAVIADREGRSRLAQSFDEQYKEPQRRM